MNRALRRYQVMAYLVGTGLLILVLIGIPLQYGAGHPGLADVVAPIHGVLYLVYLVAAFNLARQAGFSLWRLAGMVAAGFLPFLAFIIERRITDTITRQGDFDLAPDTNRAKQ